MNAPLTLDAIWRTEPAPYGAFDITLTNSGAETLSGFSLVFRSQTRLALDGTIEGATLVRRIGNLHEVAPPSGFALSPKAAWRFRFVGLDHLPRHSSDGPKIAWLQLGGHRSDVHCSDLESESDEGRVPAPKLPRGQDISSRLGILPWPKLAEVHIGAVEFRGIPDIGVTSDDPLIRKAVTEANALAQRLFPAEPAPFSEAGELSLRASPDPAVGAEAYRLEIKNKSIDLRFGDAAGCFYALVTLAQMKHAARKYPESFSFPGQLSISDAPRFAWRGCHLDTSRQFYTTAQVSGFIDILAWLKLNRFHWHLTDDEAWRPEIRAYPQLIEIASKTHMAPHGHYSQAEMRALVAKALKLHIEIVPEIDIPGHSWALLQGMPDLVDSQEIPESYHSIQGYPNNALNPGIPKTFTVLETILGEISDVFPGTYLHIGGDEVAPGAWMQSPAAKALMQKENLAGTPQLQAWFLRRIQSMLKRTGKSLAGWEEIEHGGGIDPAGTLTFAWQKPEIAAKLAAAGYDVIVTPGQAYYLDMVQDSAWAEPGMSWAGIAPPSLTYEFDPLAGIPSASLGKIRGIQACIWSEHLTSIDRFKHMVFPRLPAIAESAWTAPERKSFQRFAAIADLIPQLN